MNAGYVHIEVRELRWGGSLSSADAECAIMLPTGETATLIAHLRSDRAPYWRVLDFDDFGNPLVARAMRLIGEEQFLFRVANAAALWNVWDAVRAKDKPLD